MKLVKLVVTIVDGFPSLLDGLPYHVVEAGGPAKGARFNKKGDLVGPYASASGPLLSARQSARLIGPGHVEGNFLWLVNNRGKKLPDHFDVAEFKILLLWSRLPSGKWNSGTYLARAMEAVRRLGFDGLEIVDPAQEQGQAQKAS